MHKRHTYRHNFGTRAKGTQSLHCTMQSIVSFKAIFKLLGKKWNVKEKNSADKNTNQSHFNAQFI